MHGPENQASENVSVRLPRYWFLPGIESALPKNVLSGLFLRKSSEESNFPSHLEDGEMASRNESTGSDVATSDAAEAWRDLILERFYRQMHGREQNNFDREIFAGRDERDFRLEIRIKCIKFFFENFQALFRARDRLSDTPSRELLDRLILYRLLGHHHVKVVDDVERHWRLREEARSMQTGSSAESGRFGALHTYDVPFEQEMIRFAGWHLNVAASFLLRQYYFERDGVSIRPAPGDYLIDAGACFGDTALAFAASAGPDGRVYAFDMVPAHCRIIESNLDENPSLASRIQLFPFGVSSSDGNIGAHVSDAGGINPAAHLNPDTDPMRSIDSMVADGSIERIDFIKLDVEGSELDVLKGGEESLRRWRPKLAISIYHRLEDYYAVSDYLASLELDYSFFLDHYTIYDGETVLYATTDDGHA
jgi:FkbM family methyltransferase